MPRQSGDTNPPCDDAAAARKERPNSKRTGELAEAAFLHKAVSLGFKVTKPWGDSERYDFVLDAGERLWRVQIKCTAALHAGGYHIQPIHFVYGKNKVVYTAEDIDVLAAHIVPLDVWYVVPVEALAPGTSLRLYPDDRCKRARFEKYREAWDLLRGKGVAAVDGGTEGSRAEGDAAAGAEPEPEAQWSSVRRPIWKPRIFGIR